jgi:polysaccharide biosynthesis transport protein
MLEVMLQRPSLFQDETVNLTEESSFREMVSWLTQLFWRRLPLIAVAVLITCSLAAAYLLTAPKRYTSMAELVIDSRKAGLLPQQNPLGVDAPIDSAIVDSQVEILKSENVALAVIKDLHLTNNPEFVGGGGLISALLSLFTFDQDETPSENARLRATLNRFQRSLAIKRRAVSYVIEITYGSQDPQLSAQIANAVAEAYIVDSLEAKYQSSRRAATWLQARLTELRSEASAADRAVVDFKAKNNIVDTGGRLLSEQQLAENNSSLAIARANTAEAQARFDRINAIVQNSNPDALVNDIATVTDTLKNDVITRLRQQYLDFAAREANWAQKYGSRHLAVVNLQNQMKEIRRSIGDELRRIAESYRSDLEIAKSREQAIQTNLGSSISQTNESNQAQIVLRELESNAQSSRALSDNFLQMYMVSVQQQSFPITDARVITGASPALSPSSPKVLLIALAAIVGGGCLGFGGAIFLDLIDNVFRTAQQVEHKLGVPCIGVMPVVAANELATLRDAPNNQRPSLRSLASGRSNLLSRLRNENKRNVSAPQRQPPNVSETIQPAAHERVFQGSKIMNYILEAPFSRAAECMRSIKMSLDITSIDGSNKTVGITSTLSNEGKTTTSAALAVLQAKSGLRTLLIDGDLRNPTLSRQLTPGASIGLLEIMFGDASVEQVLWRHPTSGLDFLPIVTEDRLAHTSEILLSSAMEKLFGVLRDRYHRIIVDLSPIAPIVDVRGTGKLIDTYILVIEWGRTKADVVERAIREVPAFDSKLVGAVLNKTDLKRIVRYGSTEGDYYSSKYYERYGYR